MESVDRLRMSVTLYPALQRLIADRAITAEAVDNVIAASAEGYSFPTNLDRDPAIGGMAPQSQQALMRQALKEKWTPEAFAEAAEAQAWRKLHVTRRSERRLDISMASRRTSRGSGR